VRKSKLPPTQPDFVLVREVLPEFAQKLRTSLLRMRQPQLAEQVPELRIYGRCDCGMADCSTVYCVPPDERERLRGFGDDTYDPVTVAKGKIVSVQTLDPEIHAILKQLFAGREAE
jgi:hypothetical protein